MYGAAHPVIKHVETRADTFYLKVLFTPDVTARFQTGTHCGFRLGRKS